MKAISQRTAWMSLAAAIVQSGINCNDDIFLQSEWCAMLLAHLRDWGKAEDYKLELNQVPFV